MSAHIHKHVQETMNASSGLGSEPAFDKPAAKLQFNLGRSNRNGNVFEAFDLPHSTKAFKGRPVTSFRIWTPLHQAVRRRHVFS
ncbi:hypothetical protein M8818_005046 [Zalaria obscura]|uniref:Uncharacterized protein n=1 Tax=Zalaria obscura TaxID=2024903 RepID=A0ACC3SAH7_9PEZI